MNNITTDTTRHEQDLASTAPEQGAGVAHRVIEMGRTAVSAVAAVAEVAAFTARSFTRAGAARNEERYGQHPADGSRVGALLHRAHTSAHMQENRKAQQWKRELRHGPYRHHKNHSFLKRLILGS